MVAEVRPKWGRKRRKGSLWQQHAYRGCGGEGKKPGREERKKSTLRLRENEGQMAPECV
jgi:hypothetical protein